MQRKISQTQNRTASAELNQYCYNGYFTYFDRLSFQIQTEREKNAIHCNQKWTLHIVV